MADAAAEEEFDRIGDRSVHQTAQSEIGKMDEKKKKAEGDEKKMDPAGRPAFEQVGYQQKKANLEKNLSDGLNEKKEGNAEKRGFKGEEVGQAEQTQKSEKRDEI